MLRTFYFPFLSLCLVASSVSSAGENSKTTAGIKPSNIVFIMTGDVDFNELSYYAEGAGKVWTPNRDSIIASGMRFDRMRVVTPVCVSSRYPALTGRYPSHCTAYASIPTDREIRIENINNPAIGMVAPTIGQGETTLAHHLRSLGYATGLFGKHHNDKGEIDRPVDDRPRVKTIQNQPNGSKDPTVLTAVRRYYDEVVARVTRDTGFNEVGRLYYDNKETMPVPKDMLLDNSPWVTEGAVDFIERHRDGPFFLYYSSPLPHGQTVNPEAKERNVPDKSQEELIDLDRRATPAGWWENPTEVQPSSEDVLRRAQEHAPDYWPANAIMT